MSEVIIFLVLWFAVSVIVSPFIGKILGGISKYYPPVVDKNNEK